MDHPALSPAPPSASWRDDAGRPRLTGSVCGTCATAVFPIVPVCPTCMDEAMTPTAMPDEGTLYSYTTLHVGPKEWTKPYAVGYVDLANGVRVFGHLVGTAHRIGEPVVLTTTALSPVHETFAFRAKDVTR